MTGKESVSPLAERIFSRCRLRSLQTRPRPASPSRARLGWSRLINREMEREGGIFRYFILLSTQSGETHPLTCNECGRAEGIDLKDSSGVFAEPQPQTQTQEGSSHNLQETHRSTVKYREVHCLVTHPQNFCPCPSHPLCAEIFM